jgi:hypothetical protein
MLASGPGTPGDDECEAGRRQQANKRERAVVGNDDAGESFSRGLEYCRMRRLRINRNVVSETLDHESVLLNLDTGVYFTLNLAGTRAWELIQEHGEFERVVDVMHDEFAASKDTIASDLRTLVRELADKKLLTISPEDGGG